MCPELGAWNFSKLTAQGDVGSVQQLWRKGPVSQASGVRAAEGSRGSPC